MIRLFIITDELFLEKKGHQLFNKRDPLAVFITALKLYYISICSVRIG